MLTQKLLAAVGVAGALLLGCLLMHPRIHGVDTLPRSIAHRL